MPEDSIALFNAARDTLQDVRNHVMHIVFPSGTFSPGQAAILADTSKTKKETLMRPIEVFLSGTLDADSPVSLLEPVPHLLHVICAEAWRHQQYTTFKETVEIL